MSEENTVDFEKRVRSSNLRSTGLRRRAPKLAFSRTYSSEWKSVCLKILEEYRNRKAKSLGRKVYGWQAVRDDIMWTYDDHDAGTKTRGRSDDLLSVGDMNSYARTGSLGQDKFRFVDEFIRGLNPSRDLRLSIQDAKQRADAQKLASFQDIYQRRQINADFIDGFQTLLGRYIYSEQIGQSFSYPQIFARIDFSYLTSIKLTWVYSKVEFGTEVISADQLIFFDGFLVPLPDIAGEYDSGIKGINIDGFDCILKLFRPQFRGHPELGHADVKLRCFVSRPNHEGSVHLSIHVAGSNQPLTPLGINLGASSRMKHVRNERDGTFEMYCDHQYDEKIEDIFRKWYKGDVF